ncbi:hypothetical protein PLICRDRAFT_276654 [Plicaturopsis crispa FD-325 SS-3]|nr:hypothetical protein PLICRDRAFT_276654 [Plicaturopsis crispa FD-325 SS-3]
MCRNEHGVIVEIACKGRQIIDSLLEEETMRRETQARRPSGPRDPDQVEADAESLRSLFKRVAAAVSTVRVPSNGISTLAPVNSGPDSTGSSVPPVDTPPAAAGLASVEPREDLLQQTDWDMFTQEAFSNPAFGGFGSMF